MWQQYGQKTKSGNYIIEFADFVSCAIKLRSLSGKTYHAAYRLTCETNRQTDRQTDIVLTERKSLQTYLSYK